MCSSGSQLERCFNPVTAIISFPAGFSFVIMALPIMVRPNGDGYEVVYDHRRLEAARRAELTEIPVIVEGVDDDETLVQALIENLHREDMTANVKAQALLELQRVKGWSAREMSRQRVMSITQINRHLSIFEETEKVQGMIRNGSVIVQHAAEIKYANVGTPRSENR